MKRESRISDAGLALMSQKNRTSGSCSPSAISSNHRKTIHLLGAEGRRQVRNKKRRFTRFVTIALGERDPSAPSVSYSSSNGTTRMTRPGAVRPR